MNDKRIDRSKSLEEIAIDDSDSNYINREDWEGFEKFHNNQTNKFYDVFKEEVVSHNLKRPDKDRLLSLAGIPRYGGDLRVSDRNVKEKLHDFVHHSLVDYFPTFDEEFHFYFATVVDDRWIFPYDKPVGNFYDIRERVQRVLRDKGTLSAFGIVEFDVQKNSHVFNGKRALMAHAHLLLWQKEKVPAITIESSLEHHFKSKATDRTFHVSKVKYRKNIFKIASYISKVPPGAKLRWVLSGSDGDYTAEHKHVELVPSEVIRLMEINSEIHVNSLFIGVGKNGDVAKELKKSIKSQFTQWHREQINLSKNKNKSVSKPYSSRGIYLDQTRATWAYIKKKYGFKNMAPSELVYKRSRRR